MNVLVIAPHPDDEVIGCGGAVCLHAKDGDRVSAVFLTSGEIGLRHLPKEKAWGIREREAKQAAKILGIANLHFLRQPDWTLGDHVKEASSLLAPVLEKEKPQIIYLPHPEDGHPDHQAALGILRTALKRIRKLNPQLLAYEIWSPLASHDVVTNITPVMPRKVRALRAHRSQLNDFDYVKGVIGLNQYRGEIAGKCRFAEVFRSLPAR